ncbi:hypothetical protein [Glutamicibacter sp. 2E12]|uniref:hypothetical protein n=1 Tax=Glutamicibacter sp. 2E12 TaxID=3416181 RepID=UPI003CF79BD9
MNLDHFRKETHVTEDLVEQLAIVSWEDIRKRANAPLPSWEVAPADEKNQNRANVLAVLNMIVPVLIEQGWIPPTVNDAIREAVRDFSIHDLHKSLMNPFMIDREASGHTTQEGLAGYSEGVEHGIHTLAMRIRHALNGVPSTVAQDIAEANAAKVRRLEILRDQLDAEGMNASVVGRMWEALDGAK